MKFIGITGGVGAGKTAILSYLKEKPGCRVMLADEIAHELMKPGTRCYEKIKACFSKEDIFLPDGSLDRGKTAICIFADAKKRNQMNAIVHPAVKEFVKEQVSLEKHRKQVDYLFFEAALLIEEQYDAICDELWYIYTSEENRRERLIASRGYSLEKINSIFKSQLDEETYRTHCSVVIDNNDIPEVAFDQIERALRRIADE